MIQGKPVPELVKPEVAGTVWKENNQVADEYNKPGKFTAFCAYEWTSAPDLRHWTTRNTKPQQLLGLSNLLGCLRMS